MPAPRRQRFGAARMILALAITAVVVAAALWVNAGAPPPRWIVAGLIPVLGWIYLALAAYALGYWGWRRWRDRAGRDS